MEMIDDRTINAMKRYIDASHLGKKMNTLELRGREMKVLLHLGRMDCLDAAFLAYRYGLARGYRAGKRATKAQQGR